MSLALFDLDNTLLSGDSDYLWGVFLSELGVVDSEYYAMQNQRFYDEYKAGQLDIQAFLAFSLQPLRDHRLTDLFTWRSEFIEKTIRPLISRKAIDLVEHHRQANDTLVIITATNAFVTTPIARLFNIEHLIATEPEMIDNQYTGQVNGVPCFREGKVLKLNHWLDQHQQSLNNASFYSDSHNDLPLLEQVTRPVAVDPDDNLLEIAQSRSWPIISLLDSLRG